MGLGKVGGTSRRSVRKGGGQKRDNHPGPGDGGSRRETWVDHVRTNGKSWVEFVGESKNKKFKK